MSDWQPGDVVIHKNASKRDNHGVVMDLPPSRWTQGKVPVMKNRQVWMKTENLILLSEWDMKHKSIPAYVNLREYWVKS